MQPIWQPSTEKIARSKLTKFIKIIEKKYKCNFKDYFAFHDWTVQHSAKFWYEVWLFTQIIGDLNGTPIIKHNDVFYKTQFFPNAKLNYAENLLQKNNRETAIIFYGENLAQQTLSLTQLRSKVAKMVHYLRSIGICKGDKVVGVMPNNPDTVFIMLAVVSVGAVWSVCSPDFGEQGILDRFQQINPKVLFITDGYYFKGKIIDVREKLATVIKFLPSVEYVITCPYLSLEPINHIPNKKIMPLATALDNNAEYSMLQFTRVEFNCPIFIMFSSGTTGLPKCIVHSHGGLLIQHLKEHQLHCNMQTNDKIFYFTTCGWMMWNWLVSALASDTSIVLYDGSPFHPALDSLFTIAEEERINFFGVSAKYIDNLSKNNINLAQSHDLSCIHTISSTGSPLIAENFDYVYNNISSDINLASISGGTDILSCFLLGSHNIPVYRGELQTAGLGMAVEAWNDAGESVNEQKAELVCKAPFPSMPLMFVNDPDNIKYHKAYFNKYNNVWCHGDFIEITANNGVIIHGRSDTVLNPGGVRIGTAEIYRQVEKINEIAESVAVGQNFHGDVRIVLFVKMRDNYMLTEEIISKTKKIIRTNASPRHVPEIILPTTDIPRTVNGKIVELAIANIINGQEVKNKESLANPEALTYFHNRPELNN